MTCEIYAAHATLVNIPSSRPAAGGACPAICIELVANRFLRK